MTRYPAAVLLCLAVVAGCTLGLGGDAVVEPAGAVANLEAEGSFTFEAAGTVVRQSDGPDELSAHGAVDLEAASARYYPDVAEALEHQGIIVVGRHLYVPREAEPSEQWRRGWREDDEDAWVDERALPFDAGGLLVLVGLRDATFVSTAEPGEGEAGLRCATARSDGEVEWHYCVDGEDRLRVLRSTSEAGSSDVRYGDFGLPVDATPPPDEDVVDFDAGDTAP